MAGAGWARRQPLGVQGVYVLGGGLLLVASTVGLVGLTRSGVGLAARPDAR
jgi:hypothetical protein